MVSLINNQNPATYNQNLYNRITAMMKNTIDFLVIFVEYFKKIYCKNK